MCLAAIVMEVTLSSAWNSTLTKAVSVASARIEARAGICTVEVRQLSMHKKDVDP